MRILLSPAKKMRVDTDSLAPLGLPVYLEQARELMHAVQSLSLAEAKALWKCTDKQAELNYERFAHMDLERQLTPAVLAYEGLAYQYMAPGVMTEDMLSYLQEHLRILSGFYGVLRPFAGVVPYRLEMQAKGAPEGFRNLYDFWGDRLYRACRDEDGILINLASKEYSRAVAPYLQPGDRLVEVIFGEQNGERIVQKGVYAKMARGEMVRYLAGKGARRPEDMKDFCWSGYVWDPERSRPDRYVFLRQPSARG